MNSKYVHIRPGIVRSIILYGFLILVLWLYFTRFYRASRDPFEEAQPEEPQQLDVVRIPKPIAGLPTQVNVVGKESVKELVKEMGKDPIKEAVKGFTKMPTKIPTRTSMRVSTKEPIRINPKLTAIKGTQASIAKKAVQVAETKLKESSTPDKLPSMLFMIRYTREMDPSDHDPYLNTTINKFCQYKCEYTIDRRRLPTIDGIFLQPSEINEHGPKRYSSKQTFFAFLREAPGQVYSTNYKWLAPRQINYTVGFVPGCDIYSGYDELIPKGVDYFGHVPDRKIITNEEEWENVRRAAQNKTKGGFAVISHCNTNGNRGIYLKEFQKRYPHLLDLYGKCYSGFCKDCMERNMIDHHFYFAFENVVCDNYITEKFFRMKQFIIPVVLRKADYLNVVPEHSYIAADEFESMDAFAKHLEFLMNNRDEFLKYFEWINHFQIVPPNQPHQIHRALCRSCEKLHEPGRISTYDNLTAWYSPSRHCDFGFVPRLLKKHLQNTIDLPAAV